MKTSALVNDILAGSNDEQFLAFFESFHAQKLESAEATGHTDISYPRTMIRRLFNVAGKEPPATAPGDRERVELPAVQVGWALNAARTRLFRPGR